jgi:hypothetical protein
MQFNVQDETRPTHVAITHDKQYSAQLGSEKPSDMLVNVFKTIIIFFIRVAC